MTISADATPRATQVRFDDDQMWVELDDGRTLGVPLAWFPRLFQGSKADRGAVEIGTGGLHWDVLDEDISIAGRGDRTLSPRSKAA